jgi:methionyl-tRNA synthetase
MASYTEFEAHVRPLLDGGATGAPLPAALAAADVRRGLDALRPAGFDAALAARSLLTGLAAGAPGTEALRTALTGR